MSVLFELSASFVRMLVTGTLGERGSKQVVTNIKPIRTNTKHLIREIMNILLIQTLLEVSEI